MGEGGGGHGSHLHQVLLHIGGEILQDVHLALQLLGDRRDREDKMAAVGQIVVNVPELGEEINLKKKSVNPRGTAPETTGGPYLWLAGSTMWVPLLKRTPMQRLDSWYPKPYLLE